MIKLIKRKKQIKITLNFLVFYYQEVLLATQNDCKILTAVKVSSTEDKWCALRIQGLQPLNKPMRAWILKRCGLKKFSFILYEFVC